MDKEQEVKEAIGVILSDKANYPSSLNYAVDYAFQGMYMKGEELRVQCLYILNNITHWRHPEAKRVRTVLRAFTKVNTERRLKC